MAEIGAVITIIDLVVLSGKVLSSCYEYIGKVKDAPQDIQRVISEIAILKAILDQLKILASSAGEGQLNNLKALEVPDGPFQSCISALNELETKITSITKASNVRRRLLWPIEGPKLEQILAKLEKHKSTFNTALTSDSLVVNIETSDRVENVSSQLDEMKLLEERKRILQWLHGPDPAANHQAARKKHEKGTGDWLLESDEFKRWKNEDCSILWHFGISGSGKTILSSTVIDYLMAESKKEEACRVAYYYFDFSDHQKQTADNCIRSLVRQLCEQSDVIPEELKVLYADLQGAAPALDQLVPTLVSILANDFIIIDALDECNENLHDRERTLFFEMLREIKDSARRPFKIMITSRPEPDIKSEMNDLNATVLRAEQEKVNVDILALIRGSLAKDKRLSKWPHKVKEEIESGLMEGAHGMFRWVVCQLDSLRTRLRLRDMREELKNLPRTLEETYARIFKKVPQVYEKELRTILMLLAFSTRPMTIPEIAEAAAVSLERQSFSKDDRFFDPLDILELCSSLVSETEIRNQRAGFEGWPRDHFIKGIQFAHFSVKEYILSENAQRTMSPGLQIIVSSSHRMITEICLIYLLDFNAGEKELVFNHEEFPLLSYAALNWTIHFALVAKTNRAQIDLLLLRLFDPNDLNNLMNYLNLYDPISHWNRNIDTKKDGFLRYGTRKRNRQDFETPLYYACYYGLLPVVDALIGRVGKDNRSMEELGSALEAAASEGHVHVMRRLLERGADPNSPWGHQFHRPLQAAGSSGNLDAVELLLDAGASLGASGGELGTALHAAAKKGNPRVVQALIDRGHELDINVHGEGTPLITAARCGNDEAVSVLVKAGANPNIQGGYYGNPLYAACEFATIDAVRTLLEGGAEINKSRSRGDLPIHAAAKRGYLDILKLLVERGSKINASGSVYGTALKCAIHSHDDKVLQFFLDNGADINLSGSTTKLPVDQAIFAGNVEAADKLLELGAAFGIEALGEALDHEKKEYLAKKLLDRGADPNAEHERSGNMLQHAICQRCNQQTIIWLLDAGADVNAIEGEHGTALQAAIDRQTDDVVSLLLDHGALLNHPPCGEHGNPLQAAITRKNDSVVKLLIDRGADVNAPGGKYGSPLQAAVISERESTVKLLLGKGAEVNTVCGPYGTSLRAALASGNESITKLLIASGADLSSKVTAEHSAAGNEWRTSTFKSSLEVAVASGNNNIVQIVLDSGANLDEKDICTAALVQATFCSESSGISAIEYLIMKGADVENCGGSALNYAVEMGNEQKVKILLRHKASTSQEFPYYGSALQASIERYNLDIFHLLLDAGADVNAQGGDYGTALCSAIKEGVKPVFMELLGRGADINLKSGKWGTALMIAISNGDEEMMRELMDRGADIHAYCGDHGNALETAICRGYYNIAYELLDKGADPRLPGGYATALVAASGYKTTGQLELMRRVISDGCDLEAQSQYRPESIFAENVILFFALQRAAHAGNEPAALLLLESGANVNTQGGTYGTALQAACKETHVEMVRLLLAKGADVNANAGKYSTALQAATAEGSDIIVNLLLQHGADVNIEGGLYGTAIEAASRFGRVAHVKLFLDHGAAVNREGGVYGSPLQAAAKSGHSDTIQLLLDYGADVNLPVGGRHGCALQAAACTRYCKPAEIENMKLLLAAGADVNAVGGKYGSALQAAAYHHKAYVELLLRHGADPRIKGGKYGSPLGAAEKKKFYRVIKLLS